MKLKIWVLFALFLKVIDVTTTHYLVSKFGIEGEANPLVYATIDFSGITAAMLLNFLVFAWLLMIVFQKKQLLSAIIISGIMSVVAINNILAILYLVL